ncbi:4-hydroxy-tetrahydrodipicolinate synthase [Liberiplasma polymorphum]|uniref:4-hydroxy-tetrahydrodipicolinate synthase n=1 Tax=Liberiplasma polymorphum TaxID=3374570 RepID=UPI003774FE60
MKLFRGSGVALITPFVNGEINLPLFIKLIEWHIKKETDALIISGTTGESATLSKEEKLLIFETAVQISGGKIPIIANTGTNNTKESIELSIEAEALGVDGLLLVTPYYNKPTQRGMIAHFKAIAEKVLIPIILYNVPSRTGVNLEASSVIELSNIPNIVGVKEASGDLTQVRAIVEGTHKEFALYSGNDDLIFETMQQGGDGVISVVANITPFETHQICVEFDSHKENARLIQERLDILNNVLFCESNPVPVKEALTILGVDASEVRLPLTSLLKENKQLLKEALDTYGLREIKL